MEQFIVSEASRLQMVCILLYESNSEVCLVYSSLLFGDERRRVVVCLVLVYRIRV